MLSRADGPLRVSVTRCFRMSLNASMAFTYSCSLFPKLAYMLKRLIPIAAVKSANDAFSNPFSAKTSMAACRACFSQNAVGRPGGFPDDFLGIPQILLFLTER